MPASVPVPAVSVGQTYTDTAYNGYLKDNMNKLLNQGHRVLTVAQFAALTGLEGTKGVVAPDEVYLEVDSTNGIQWHLAYESGEPTYKWRFLGGPPMVSEVTTPEGTASARYVALTTAGPSIALPRGGDFRVEQDFDASNSANLGDCWMGYDIGATGAVDADASRIQSANGGIFHGGRSRVKAALTAVTLTSKYGATTGTATFLNRAMRVTPTRLI